VEPTRKRWGYGVSGWVSQKKPRGREKQMYDRVFGNKEDSDKKQKQQTPREDSTQKSHRKLADHTIRVRARTDSKLTNVILYLSSSRNQEKNAHAKTEKRNSTNHN